MLKKFLGYWYNIIIVLFVIINVVKFEFRGFDVIYKIMLDKYFLNNLIF